MKRKLLSVFLALSLLLTLTPTWAWAAATGGQAGAKLTGMDKRVYDALKTQITAVANTTGESGTVSTEFKVYLNQLLDTTDAAYSFLAGTTDAATTNNADGFDSTELSLASATTTIPTGFTNSGQTTFSNTGYDAAQAKLNAALTSFGNFSSSSAASVVNALLADCPYELYWFDKVGGAGYSFGRTGYGINPVVTTKGDYNVLTINGSFLAYANNTSQETLLSTAEGITKVQYTYTTDNENYSVGLPYLTFGFSVSKDYAPNEANRGGKLADATKLKAAKTAVDGNKVSNSNDIVTTNESGTEYAKMVAFKNAICAAVSYDSDSASSYANVYGIPWQLIPAFGGGTGGQIVCEGYSKAFKYLCDQAGIECYLVTGTMSSSGTANSGSDNHMWNIVRLDGKSYLVDVTNCDEGTIGASDKLFLKAPTSGSYPTYTYTINEQNIVYTYGDDTKTQWGESLLTLATENYGLPTITAYSNVPATLTVGTAITEMAPTYSGVNAVNTTNPYALASGTLPAGLSLNASTGAITGTPTTYNASTSTVTITVKDTADQVSEAYSITFPAVAKGTPAVTAPTAQTPTYTGSAQALVNAGSSAHGTIQYRLGTTGEWSEGIPTATNAGTYSVNYRLVGDANHLDKSDYEAVSVTISAKSISGVTVADISAQTYTGSQIKPEPTVTDSTTVLTKGTDYTYSYGDNINAGTSAGSVTVNGTGNYTGSTAAKQFDISKAAQTLSANNLTVKTSGTLTNEQLKAAVSGAQGELTFSITDAGGTGLSTGSITAFTASTNTGTATVTATAAETTNYNTANTTFTVSVQAKVVETTTMSVTQAGTTYGTALGDPVVSNQPDSITVAMTYTYSGTLRSDGSAYSSAEKPTAAGTYTVTARCETAETVYTATSASFTIAPLSISDATVTLGEALTYTGSAQTKTVTTVKLGETDITNSCDVTGNTGTNAGDYTLTVTAKGASNYTGSKTETWSIARANATVTAPTVVAVDLTYNGAAQSLLATNGSATGGELQYSLTSGSGYSTVAPSATDAGSYTVYYRVVGDANHNDVAEASLAAKTIGKAALTVTAAAQTITYGESIATTVDKATAATLQTGDTLSAVTLTPSGTTVTVSGTITPSAAVIKKGDTDVTSNYDISYNTGALTISQANPTGSNVTKSVTMDANAQTLTVPFSEFALSPSGCTLTGPTVTGTAAGVTATIEGSNITVNIPNSSEFTGKQSVVTLTITPSDTTNYTGTQTVLLTVTYTAKPVPTLTANDLSVTYKGAAYTVADVANKTAKVDSTDVPGTWSISGDPDLTNANSGVAVTLVFTPNDTNTYAGATKNITVTIAKADLNIKANDKNVTVGTEEVPGLVATEFTATGLKGSDAISGVTLAYSGEPALDSVNSTTKITPSAAVFSTGSANNYNITYTQGTLNVVAATVTVTYNANGGSVSPSSASVSVGGTISSLPTPTRSGYSFDGWYTASSGGTQITTSTTFSSDQTIYAHWSAVSSGDDTTPDYDYSTDSSSGTGSSSGGSGSSGSTGTTTTTNADGSRTTTTTSANGTVTETTTQANGDRTVTVTNPNGSSTETKTTTDGTTIVTQTDTTGASTTEGHDANGTTASAKTDSDGNLTEASATVSYATVSAAVTEAAGTDETPTVTLPVEVPAAASAATAAEIEIDMPSIVSESNPVKVEIPVEDVQTTTVVVLVNPDGTEEIVKDCTVTADGVVLGVTGDVTVKVVDNAKTFSDPIPAWASDAIDFVTAREIFNGSDGAFNANDPTSRGMVAQVLFNFDRESDPDASGSFGDAAGRWYDTAASWASSIGVINGDNGNFNGNNPVTRQDLATILYRYAGAKGYDTTVSGSLSRFPDALSVADYAQTAMQWAMSKGIIGGIEGNLSATTGATRAQVATMMARFVNNIVK